MNRCIISSNGHQRDMPSFVVSLSHWGRVMHICISKLTIISSDYGLSPGRRQAIIWTNAGILSICTLGTNSSEILSKVCLGFNVLRLPTGLPLAHEDHPWSARAPPHCAHSHPLGCWKPTYWKQQRTFIRTCHHSLRAKLFSRHINM